MRSSRKLGQKSSHINDSVHLLPWDRKDKVFRAANQVVLEEGLMLRGDPVLISPVHVFGAEYLSDIGWPGRTLLDMLSPRLRRYWRFFEVSSVFGTLSLAILELYLVFHKAFLYVGIAAIVVWAIWLLGNQLFFARCLICRVA